MPKIKFAPIPDGIKLDTNGWIRCDRCGNWIHSNEPKVVNGMVIGTINLLQVYHPNCHRLQEKGKYLSHLSPKFWRSE